MTKIYKLLKIVELPKTSLQFMNLDYHSALYKLEEFKFKLKNQRRILANKYHPDKLHGDVEKMKNINSAIDSLLKLEVRVPQQNLVVIFGNASFDEVLTNWYENNSIKSKENWVKNNTKRTDYVKNFIGD